MDTRFDFHIHTTYLRCANETMAIPAILAEGARLGVTRLGLGPERLWAPSGKPFRAARPS
ncbi:MAG: hypothetical protein GX595_12575 [Lentisphaerae bacterium]|nr:hypothetical protein [Lentisphaerota bacterium]